MRRAVIYSAIAAKPDEPKPERQITGTFRIGSSKVIHKGVNGARGFIGITRSIGGEAGLRNWRNAMKMKNSIGALVLAATAITGFSATPAAARHYENDGYYRQHRDDDRYDRYDRDDRREYRRDSYYRGNRCDKGTGGTVIGAVAGGLLGNQVARRGNRTEGTIIGAAVGALAGRAIDRSDSNCRRYR
jgi:Glycine zipper 2TM domain